MNIEEAGRVLRKLVAFQPNTPRDEYTINAWVESRPPDTPMTTFGLPMARKRCSRPETWIEYAS